MKELRSPAMHWLLVIAMLLLTAWSLAVPIFEAPDEPHHWSVACYIHDHRRLPPYNVNYVEANQPPLYYLLVAPFASSSVLPPHAALLRDGKVTLSCPPRFYQNCRSDFHKYWPIRIVRLVTALFSLGTVAFTYLAAAEASASRTTGLLAGAMVGFLPQFTFRGSTINNDAIVACTCAAAIWYLVRFSRSGEVRAAMWFCIACAIAFLSKINAIVVVGAYLVCAISLPLPWRQRLQRMGLLLITLVIASPWLIRNRILYGDVLAQGIMPKVVPILVDRKPITSPYFRTVFFPALWHSYVGIFGWMNVGMPALIYELFELLALAGCIGIVVGLVRHRLDRRIVGLLFLIMILAVAGVVQLNLTFSQPQGRYLFPALSACMIFLAMGFSSFPQWGRANTYVLAAVLAAINIYVLVAVIYPAYWKPIQPSLLVDTSLPELTTGALTPDSLTHSHSLVQSFVAKHNNLSAVEVTLVSERPIMSSGDVSVHIKRTLNAATDIAKTEVPASTLGHISTNVRVAFAPIPDSEEKTYYVLIDAQRLKPDAVINVPLRAHDAYPQGNLFMDGVLQDENLSFQSFYLDPPRPCPACLAK